MSADEHNTDPVVRLSFASRLVLNCVGCGFEAASVALGPVNDPDETYGDRCWNNEARWAARPAHTHLDGHDCDWCAR